MTSFSDINYLVMDYLITNGYPAAAKKFAIEANIQRKPDLECIQERVEIRTAIHSGNIQLAIEKINDLNPQVRILSLIMPHANTITPLPSPCCYDYQQFHAPLLEHPSGSCG